jgi:hypothetical protein
VPDFSKQPDRCLRIPKRYRRQQASITIRTASQISEPVLSPRNHRDDRLSHPKPPLSSKGDRTIRFPQDGQDYLIRVDSLTPRPLAGQGRAHRHRPVQRDLKARTLEGVEVALTHRFWYELEAQLPDGAQARVRLKVADLVASLALKGIAIGERYAEKDAYDISAICAHYPGGPPAVAAALTPFINEQPVQRGLRAIAQKFRALEAEGPTWIAKCLGGCPTLA